MKLNKRTPIVIIVALTLAQGCRNVQNGMIFSTGTTFGLEVSSEPASANYVRMVVGYKRLEVLIDPVIEELNKKSKDDKKFSIKPAAHSVLAKLSGQFSARNNGSGQVSQWFASGRAAEILAAHGGAVALTNDPKVAEAASKTILAGNLPEENQFITYDLLSFINNSLSELKTEEAKRHLTALNTIPHELGIHKDTSFIKFQINENGNKGYLSSTLMPLKPIKTFEGLYEYAANLLESTMSLEKAIELAEHQTLYEGDSYDSLVKQEHLLLLKNSYKIQKQTLSDLKHSMCNHANVIEAAKYINRLMYHNMENKK